MYVRNFTLCLLVSLALLVQSSQALALDADEIIKMHNEGASSHKLLGALQYTPVEQWSFEKVDLQRLKKAGVSALVLQRLERRMQGLEAALRQRRLERAPFGQEYSSGLQRCFLKGSSGRARVQWGADGRPKAVKLLDVTTLSKGNRRCVQRALSGWQIKPTGAPLTLEMPLPLHSPSPKKRAGRAPYQGPTLGARYTKPELMAPLRYPSQREIERCFGLAGTKKGPLHLRLQFDKSGQVRSIEARPKSVHKKELKSCFREVLGQWSIEPLTGPATLDLTIPIPAKANTIFFTAPSAKMVIGDLKHKGGADSKLFRALLEDELFALRDCYQRELKFEPRLKGELRLRSFLKRNGRIEQTRARKSTLKNKSVESCLLKHIDTLKSGARLVGDKRLGAYEYTLRFSPAP